jgi:murein DD-endopeptidase MepM/ murein hydrolase activator NlpD
MVKLKKLPLDSITVNSTFGLRDITLDGRKYWWHNGIDLKADLGTPVYAVAEGIVKRAVENIGSYGNYLVVDHGKFGTLYAHLSSYVVQVGQTVSSGDILGYTGQTGAVTAPHLHFEIRVCEYDNFWDRCECDSSVFMRCVDPKIYFDDYEERNAELAVDLAATIVKKSAGLEDKTMDYIVNDYKFGEALIKKLAKAIK